MTEHRIEEALKDPTFRRKLAESMAIPLRCGGCDYDDQGRRFYIFGGRRVLEDSEEYRAICRKHGYQR